MLTSTVERIKEHNVVGDPLCWSMYGEPVGLG